MNVRLMQTEDVGQVARLEQLCFSDAWSEHLLTEGLTNKLDSYLVCENDGEIVGYSVLRVLAGEGEIQRIAVLPTHRRVGIARRLMEKMVEISREKEAMEVSLEVRAGNTAARNLYESYGFLPEAVRKAYYHDPEEDAVIMWNRRI